jgi:hypothetical protein
MQSEAEEPIATSQGRKMQILKIDQFDLSSPWRSGDPYVSGKQCFTYRTAKLVVSDSPDLPQLPKVRPLHTNSQS